MGSALVTEPREDASGSVENPITRFVPEHPTPTEDLVRALRGVKALESLNEDELRWLAENGVEQLAPDGASVFRGGDPVHEMAIVLRGEIHVRRTSGPVAFFIGRSAHLTGKLPFSRMKSYGGDGYAVGDVWTLSFDESTFPTVLAAIPKLAQLSVSTLLDRVREVTRMEQQAEKLNALGKLAANLSHELNNPASAARSAANNLWTELRNYGDQKFKLGSLCFNAETKQAYGEWINSIRHLLQEDGRPMRSDAIDIAG
jgi:signal transduction histidine kinase